MLHDFSCPRIFMMLIWCDPTPRTLENRAPTTSACFWTPTASEYLSTVEPLYSGHPWDSF